MKPRTLAPVLLFAVVLTAQTPAPTPAPSPSPAPSPTASTATVAPIVDFLTFALGDAASGFAQSKARGASGGFDYNEYLTDCYYADADTTLGRRVACYVSADLPLNGASLKGAVERALPAGFTPEAAVLDGEYAWGEAGKVEVSLDTSVAGSSIMVEDLTTAPSP